MENQESLLSIAKAAKLMGVSPKILKEKVSRGEIKTVSWGTEVRIPRWYISKWQAEQLTQAEV